MSDHPDHRRGVVEAGAQVAGAGLLIGVLGGGLGLLTGGTSAEMAESASRAAWLLAPAFAATLIWSLLSGSGQGGVLHRRSTDGPTCALVVVVGPLAALLGCGLFLVSATNVPVLFSDAGAVEFRSELTSQFGWYDAMVVVAVTFVVSTILALWAFGRRSAS